MSKKVVSFIEFNESKLMEDGKKPPKRNPPTPYTYIPPTGDWLGTGGGHESSYGAKQVLKYVDPPTKDFTDKYEKEFNKAIKTWKTWLSHPTTKLKFKQNYIKIGDKSTASKCDSIFKEYIDRLNKMKLVYYSNNHSAVIPEKGVKPYNLAGKGLDRAYAFISGDTKYDTYLFVNYSKNDPNILGTLIHEIQHSLYHIKPLNPESNIGSAFIKAGGERSNLYSGLFGKGLIEAGKKIYDRLFGNKSESDIKSEILSIQKMDPAKITKEYAKNIHAFWCDRVSKFTNKKNPGYICRETENLSRIMSIRTTVFNLSPDQNITKAMIMPYIIGTKYDDDVLYFLLCWAQKGFKDLEALLNDVNALAKNKDIDKQGDKKEMFA